MMVNIGPGAKRPLLLRTTGTATITDDKFL